MLLTVMALAWPVAATAKEPDEGFDYEVFEPAPGMPRVEGKITVIESFWYQCPQCNALLPLIEYWAKKHEKTIHFVRVPLAMREGYADQEILYHALEELGEVDRLHTVVFEAIHYEHQPLKTLEEMAELLEWHDIPAQRFLEVARSPAVKARHAAGRQLLAHYGITGVPVIVVDGRYLTSATRIGGSHADSLVVAEWLLRRAEAELKVRAAQQ